MAVSSSVFAHGKATAPEEKKTRVKKADRPFSPPELGLVPSDYVKTALEQHYLRLDKDAEYRAAYELFRRARKRKNITQEEGMVAWREKQTGPAPIRVRASELKTCARQVALRLMGAPEEPIGENSPHWKLAALSGEQMHEELEIALKYLRLVKRSEFRVYSEAKDFSGRVDAELAAAPAILDIKTVTPDDFKEGPWGSKVQGYIDQITAYCHLTGNSLGVVLLVDRGSGKLLEFSWEVTPEAGERVLQRASSIAQAATERKLPAAEWRSEAGKFDFKCWTFCPFKDICMTQEFTGRIQEELDAGVDPKTLKGDRSQETTEG